MKIFRIDQIKFDPYTIIAEDGDHAAQIFIYALMQGLQNQPGLDFSVSEWMPYRISRFPTLQRWAEEGRVGIAWTVDEEASWELVHYDFHRS